MDNKQLAQQIVKLVGGKSNIKSVTHCITRLRFHLKDNSKANTEELEKLDILGVQVQGGQYQVIIGNAVGKVYKEIISIYPQFASEQEQESGPNKGFINNILDTLSSILIAALPPIIGGGMLKGITFILTNYNLIAVDGEIAFLLDVMSNCMFTFIPFLLALSSARKFKTNEYMALSLAGVLMFPTIANAAAQKMPPLKLFGFLEIPMIDYASSVIPIILSVFVLKYVYNFFEAKIPSMINTIFTPVLTFVIMVPITLIVIAPIGYYGGNYVAYGIEMMINTAPWLAGFVIGATRPFLVITGMHHAIRPIQYQQISTFGYTTITPANFLSTMSQATAFLATYVLMKDKKGKQVALSATVSGFLGITEPGLYGIIMKYRAALIGTFLGGGLGGMVATALGAKAYASAMPSILTIPVFMGGGAASIIIGLIVTIVSTFAITFILGKSVFKVDGVSISNNEKKEVKETNNIYEVLSPVEGTIYKIEDVKDDTFSKKMLGESVAIMPKKGEIYSPIDGKVETIFSTKHAIGLKDENGVEVLIHVGIDTVKLEGKYFYAKVKTNDEIKKGDLLLTFDLDKIKEKGYDPTVIIAITNTSNYLSVVPEFDSGSIFVNEKLITVVE